MHKLFFLKGVFFCLIPVKKAISIKALKVKQKYIIFLIFKEKTKFILDGEDHLLRNWNILGKMININKTVKKVFEEMTEMGKNTQNQ